MGGEGERKSFKARERNRDRKRDREKYIEKGRDGGWGVSGCKRRKTEEKEKERKIAFGGK